MRGIACGMGVALEESGTRHDELAEQMAFSPRPEVRRGRVARFRNPRPDPRGPWVLLPVPPGSPIPPHPFRAALRPPGGPLFFAPRLRLSGNTYELTTCGFGAIAGNGACFIAWRRT